MGTTYFCRPWVAAVAGLSLAPAVTLGADGLRPRLSVMHLTGSGIAKSDLRALEPLLAFELARDGAYDVVTVAELDALFGAERAKDLAGCDNVVCASEIAAALDAKLMVTGAINLIGDRLFVNLSLLDVRGRRVLRRAQRECPDDASLVPIAIRQAVANLHAPEPAEAAPAVDPEVRWLARLDRLAGEEIECRDLDACIPAVRSRLDEIARILAGAAWTPETENRREALAAKHAALRRQLDALQTTILRRGGNEYQHEVANPAAPGTEPVDPGDFSDPVAGAVVELQEIQRRLESTQWEWSNRDERAKLKRRAAEIEVVLRRAERDMQRAPQTQLWGQSSEERALSAEIEALQRELATTSWRWSNRDRKAAVNSRIAFLEGTLARIRALRAPAPTTQKP